MYPGDIEQMVRDHQASLLAEAERQRLLDLARAARVVRGDPAEGWMARAAGLAAAAARLVLAPGGRILVLFRRPPSAAPGRRRPEAPGQQPA
jgi:hypothetical protein